MFSYELNLLGTHLFGKPFWEQLVQQDEQILYCRSREKQFVLARKQSNLKEGNGNRRKPKVIDQTNEGRHWKWQQTYQICAKKYKQF